MAVSAANEAATHERCHFTCVYCGFDGRTFDGWMQLSIDHILPRQCDGDDDPANLVTACGSCNSVTSKMKDFADCKDLAQIVVKKRQYVLQQRQGYLAHWLKNIAPLSVTRPLLSAPVLPSEVLKTNAPAVAHPSEQRKDCERCGGTGSTRKGEPCVYCDGTGSASD